MVFDVFSACDGELRTSMGSRVQLILGLPLSSLGSRNTFEGFEQLDRRLALLHIDKIIKSEPCVPRAI